MEVRQISLDAATLSRYAELFLHCFPGARHLDAGYLEWLYCANPAGPAVGFDAWSGDRLAAHYACIPVDAFVAGASARLALSLNTATHPDFQGRGLFTRLAQCTYDAAAASGLAAVYGVANANSTPGFVKKLGFTLVRPLDALVGLGSLPSCHSGAVQFARRWTSESLAWRVSSPARPYRLVRHDGGVAAEAPAGYPGLKAWDELDTGAASMGSLQRPTHALKLHLGLRPADAVRRGAWMEIPKRLRPSPLNLIYRPLLAGQSVPAADAIRLGQLDFDAF